MPASKRPARPSRKATPRAPIAARAIGASAARRIDQRIRDLGDWRGETLARMRTLILEADPEMTEEWKWMGTPVWSHHGNVCTGESYKAVVKLTFARGASLADPARLFNASLEGSTRRAIDIRQGETVNARAFKALVKAAVALNAGSVEKAGRSGKAKAGGRGGAKAPVVLLSGGNPQIAKADGAAPRATARHGKGSAARVRVHSHRPRRGRRGATLDARAALSSPPPGRRAAERSSAPT